MVKKIERLGKGGFGEVWSAYMNKHTKVAVKNLLNDKDASSINEVMHEVEIMELVRHPRLINCYGFWKDGEHTAWIIDLLLGGDLDKLLHENKDKKLSMIERFIIARNIAIGIQGFHVKKIIHRDIKSCNVLFPEEISKDTIIRQAKLADYGAAIDLNSNKIKFIRENKDTLDEFEIGDIYNGTLQYAPKEVLTGDLRIQSEKSDIYAFGVLIWEIFTNVRPLDGVPDDVIQKSAYKEEPLLKPWSRFANGKVISEKIPFVDETPAEEIEKLIEECLSDDMEKRPSIDDIIDELIRIVEKHGLTHAEV